MPDPDGVRIEKDNYRPANVAALSGHDALLAENQHLGDLLQDAIAYLDRGEFPGDGIMARNLREALAGDGE